MPDIEQLLRQLIQSGKVPPALMETLTEAQNDPSKLGPLLEKLTALVGPSAPAPLNIEDYYQASVRSHLEAAERARSAA
jgi:hypothetical protein